MIFNFDSITLSFLVVASVTLAVVVVLVWYVYSSKKFKNDILDLMDEKLSDYLKNLEQPKQEEEEEPQEVPDELPPLLDEQQKDESEFAEKSEEQEEPQSFVEKPHE